MVLGAPLPPGVHNSAPDLTLAAVSQRTSRIRLGIGVVLAPIHHPLHVAARMATLDILSHGRVDVGLGRTGYPYQLTPYGSDLRDTRGMWQEFAEVLPRIWTQEEISYDGTILPDPSPGGPHEAGATAAPAAVVRVRQRRDGAPDGQPGDGRAVRQRRRPGPRPTTDGAISGRAADGRPKEGHPGQGRLGQRGRAHPVRRADDCGLLP
jgi:alkanesulfonate monooxygenase SsuD/methylene tetrahydromethanopterin reductase-like flavin-dependent oxidoreductase (luciferase family)